MKKEKHKEARLNSFLKSVAASSGRKFFSSFLINLEKVNDLFLHGEIKLKKWQKKNAYQTNHLRKARLQQINQQKNI